MNLKVCEKCGSTDRDPSANIEVISVKSRQNGNVEALYEGSIEACQSCRGQIQETLTRLFTQEPILEIRINMAGGAFLPINALHGEGDSAPPKKRIHQ